MNDDLKFATSFKCTKEVCKVGKQSMNVPASCHWGHLSVKIGSNLCKKYENKKNMCNNQLQLIKSIAPNVHDNQLTLILSQIVSSDSSATEETEC